MIVYTIEIELDWMASKHNIKATIGTVYKTMVAAERAVNEFLEKEKNYFKKDIKITLKMCYIIITQEKGDRNEKRFT